MKKIFSYGTLLSVLLFPAVSFAQLTTDPTGGNLGTFVGGVISFINDVAIPLLLAVAFLVFIYGVVVYFFVASKEGDKKKEGQSLIIWGIVGFVLIVSIWGIVNLVAEGLGLTGGADTIILPSAKDI